MRCFKSHLTQCDIHSPTIHFSPPTSSPYAPPAMAISSNLVPDTGTTGGGGVTWANPGNALACDDVYTTSGPLGVGSTDTQLLTTFNYDISALNPSGQLTGLEVHIEAFIDQGTATFLSVFMLHRGLRTGDNKAAATALSTVETDYQFGGAGDLWNSNLKTVADFLHPNTGVEVACRRSGAPSPTVSIDCITLICYFDEQRPFIMRFAGGRQRPTLTANRNFRGI